MSYERIRVLSEQQDRMELRARVLEEVTRLYFERQRIRAELSRVCEQDPGESTRLILELGEVTALLDALTGGEFGWRVGGAGGGDAACGTGSTTR